MAKKLLDVAQIGALVEQVRGEGMPQAVRRNVVNVGALPEMTVGSGPRSDFRGTVEEVRFTTSPAAEIAALPGAAPST